MSDKYDDAIAYLTANPGEISEAWVSPVYHRAGCLFQFARRDYRGHQIPGCLTMIRREHYHAVSCADIELSQRLTAEIRADVRIPTWSGDTKVSDLPVFAEWQRRLDWQLLVVPQLSDDDLAKLIITKAKLELCPLPSQAPRIAAIVVPVSAALALLIGWLW